MSNSREDLTQAAKALLTDKLVDATARNNDQKTAMDVLRYRISQGAINILALRRLEESLRTDHAVYN
jgi:hypothetical protein